MQTVIENKATEPVERGLPGRQRGVKELLGLMLRGFCMGAADVVPGVSGGTMAFILGIYEELVNSIRMIGQPALIQAVLKLRIREVIALINLPFLAAVGTGVLLAIATLAKGLEWLLVNQPVLLWSFFFGLVLASVAVVSQRIDRWTGSLWGALVLGAVTAYLLVGLVPVQTPNDWWFLILSGALASCMMILPGVSGSFILVVLGKYQYILSAVTQRDIGTLLLVALGAGIGLVAFAQVLSWLFKRYHNLAVALLTGLMLGSLRKIWPWKLDLNWILDRHGEKLVTEQQNILPPLTIGGSFNMEILFAVALAAIGFAAVILLERWAGEK